MLLPGYTWHEIVGPYTVDWWELRRDKVRVALVQPFNARAVVKVFHENQIWRSHGGDAPSVDKGKQQAERWVLAQLRAGGETSCFPDSSEAEKQEGPPGSIA